MIKAGALNYSIFIMVIAGVLCILMINMAFMNRSFFIHVDIKDRLIENCNSGIALAMASKNEETLSKWYHIYGGENDSVFVRTRQWGAFKAISSRATIKGESYLKSSVLGYSNTVHSETALWLTDNNRKLQLAGTALLKGNVFLPEKGLDRAYVEGSNYNREHLVYGSKFSSTEKNLGPEKMIKSYWKNYLNGNFDPRDSIVDFNELPLHLTHSFSKRTLVAVSNSPVSLDNYQLQGNIILISHSRISVSSSSLLVHVVLIATDISFEENTHGKIHAVASDSLILGSNSMLSYPSSFINLGTSNKDGYCKISKDAQLFGAILSFSESSRKTNTLSVEIEETANIKGLVYAENNLELGGLVEGTVICNRFLLATPSGIYENHILNGKIDRSKILPDFASVPFDNVESTAKIIAWLNY